MDRLLSMRVFERVVDEGGFAAAARAMDMSAPVVTRLVADLEEHLGTRLLQRTTRRLSLTEAGQGYLSRVRNILQDIDEAHAVTSSHTTELAGLLRLHTPPVLASYVIAPLLAEFRRRYPKILIEIEVQSIKEPPIEDFDITLLGQIPIVQSIREGGDLGVPAMVGDDGITKKAFEEFAANAVRSIAMRNANMPATQIQEILE